MNTIQLPHEHTAEDMKRMHESLRQRNRGSAHAERQQLDYQALHTRETASGDSMEAHELMTRARRALARQMPEIDSLTELAGSKPEPFEKPKFGTPEYWLAHRVGWISEQEVAADKALYDKRRRTSMQTCHRYKMSAPHPKCHDRGGAYVPEMSARINNDLALTDGARRCAAKLMELIYRRNRRFRDLGMTVSYLAKCLNRTERTVQNYLRVLRERGYIRHEVVTSNQARMSIGIFITLLKPIFPRHHTKAWPDKKENPGAKSDSDKYSSYSSYIYRQKRVGVDSWTYRCMDGVLRALAMSNPHIFMEISSP